VWVWGHVTKFTQFNIQRTVHQPSLSQPPPSPLPSFVIVEPPAECPGPSQGGLMVTWSPCGTQNEVDRTPLPSSLLFKGGLPDNPSKTFLVAFHLPFHSFHLVTPHPLYQWLLFMSHKPILVKFYPAPTPVF
jgi:hypothetical protein